MDLGNKVVPNVLPLVDRKKDVNNVPQDVSSRRGVTDKLTVSQTLSFPSYLRTKK